MADETVKLAGDPVKLAAWQTEGTMAHAQRTALVAALAHCGGDVVAAARRLRIGRSTVYRLAERYHVTLRGGLTRRRTPASGKAGKPSVALVNGDYLMVVPRG